MFSWKVLVLEVPQKTCAHPFVGHHLTYPLYYPYIFHSIIWNPLATTLTVLFPHYISFTYFLNHLATTFTSLFPYYISFTNFLKHARSTSVLANLLGKHGAENFGLSQWSPQRRSRYSKYGLINISSKNINEKTKKISLYLSDIAKKN